MTSLDVASATSSPRTPTPVKERKLLWSDGVVEVNIPKVVRASAFDDGEKKIPFIQFARLVTGGVINFFIHTDNPDTFAGKTITANVKVYRREHEDGRSFLYVDLEPVDQPATRRLVVEPKFNLSMRASEVIRQTQTPAPLQGMVVIAKLKEAKEKKELEPAYTDNALDLRLENGWKIVREDANAVYIKKGDKTLAHHKIKNYSRR